MSEVEKAAQALAIGLGVSVNAGPFAWRTQPQITALIAAVRAEAIASTEAKFRELAEKWRIVVSEIHLESMTDYCMKQCSQACLDGLENTINGVKK